MDIDWISFLNKINTFLFKLYIVTLTSDGLGESEKGAVSEFLTDPTCLNQLLVELDSSHSCRVFQFVIIVAIAYFPFNYLPFPNLEHYNSEVNHL